MAADGYTWFKTVNAGRSNATVADSVPGLPGATGVDDLIANAALHLVSVPDGAVGAVLMNWGVNEMGSLPSSASWIADYKAIISYVHGLWPSAIKFISYPWRVGFDGEAAELHTRIDSIIAWCSGQGIDCRPSVDEAITIKADDNGWLETDAPTGSGVHYSNPYGVGLYAAAMQQAMGLSP